MNETQAKIYDIDVLERRIAVSDRELAFMLGVGGVHGQKNSI